MMRAGTRDADGGDGDLQGLPSDACPLGLGSTGQNLPENLRAARHGAGRDLRWPPGRGRTSMTMLSGCGTAGSTLATTLASEIHLYSQTALDCRIRGSHKGSQRRQAPSDASRPRPTVNAGRWHIKPRPAT
jgi:hypothetical protein